MQAAVWAMDHFQTLNRLQIKGNEYTFNIKHKKGTEMPADFLSLSVVFRELLKFSTSIRDGNVFTRLVGLCQDCLDPARVLLCAGGRIFDERIWSVLSGIPNDGFAHQDRPRKRALFPGAVFAG